jgi:thiamine-monophosphate kinase
VTLPAEFDLIARFFKPLAGEGSLGLADDAAVFTPPAGRDLVVSADAIVAGVHFLPDDPPETIGRKLLRVNVSDLAAMGAVPLGYFLTVSVPADTPAAWFEAFTRGLAMDQAEFGISLMGGDTTSTPGPVSLSATVIGHVAPGAALRRQGAHPGDGLWVTGTIGDGALGLRALRGEVADPDGFLAGRYRLPRPRLGLRLTGIANAAMDVSDGLLQDCGHLCRASDVSATVESARVPLSEAALAVGPLELCLTGGDDYELLLAVSPDREPALLSEFARVGLQVTRIGRFAVGEPVVTVVDGLGQTVALQNTGWSHFK